MTSAVRITRDAARHLVRLRRERQLGDDAIPRFERDGERLRLTFATRPAEGDRLVHDGRIPALIAPTASDLFDAATIDVHVSDARTRLAVHRRRAVGERPERSGDRSAEPLESGLASR